MFFELSEEHLAVQQSAREFAQNELKPGVIDRDTNMTFPTEQVKMMGELGFLGMMVDPKYGGSGMDTLSYVLAIEEISKIVWCRRYTSRGRAFVSAARGFVLQPYRDIPLARQAVLLAAD